MTTIKVLDKYDVEMRQLMQWHPEFNGTQLAQWLAGGYRGDKYPEYIKYLQAYNEIKGA